MVAHWKILSHYAPVVRNLNSIFHYVCVEFVEFLQVLDFPPTGQRHTHICDLCPDCRPVKVSLFFVLLLLRINSRPLHDSAEEKHFGNSWNIYRNLISNTGSLEYSIHVSAFREHKRRAAFTPTMGFA